VARALNVPLDVFIVRKLGVPGFEELAAGAIASGGVRVLNEDVIRALPNADEVIEDVTATETAELERREQSYRDGRFTGLSSRVSCLPLMAITEDQVKDALKSVKYPGFSRDIVSFGLIKGIDLRNGDVTVQLALATNDAAIPQTIKNEAETALRALAGVREAKVRIDIQAPPAGVGAGVGAVRIPGIKHIIAIASGKGGVGKSTIAANLAVALEQTKASVGLCDCDIYGPSISLMFGTRERPMATDDNRIIPIEQYNLRLMSMGFLLDDASPAILRGPMVTRYTQQFLRQVEWGALDYLVLDLPPGTGDIQLTIVQTVALSGAIIVTTPQEVALIDARKAATMFEKVNVPVLGLIENMSFFVSPSDGKRYDIFGIGGGEREAKRLRVPLLGQIPIDIATREAGDRGMPITAESKESAVGVEFGRIAQRLRDLLPFD
jgi:ATP-binding protein involved in chromosome partitioning